MYFKRLTNIKDSKLNRKYKLTKKHVFFLEKINKINKCLVRFIRPKGKKQITSSKDDKSDIPTHSTYIWFPSLFKFYCLFYKWFHNKKYIWFCPQFLYWTSKTLVISLVIIGVLEAYVVLMFCYSWSLTQELLRLLSLWSDNCFLVFLVWNDW